MRRHVVAIGTIVLPVWPASLVAVQHHLSLFFEDLIGEMCEHAVDVSVYKSVELLAVIPKTLLTVLMVGRGPGVVGCYRSVFLADQIGYF